MIQVSPSKLRATVSQHADSLTISIPARRNWLALGFLCLWLYFWSPMGSRILLNLYNRPTLVFDLFTLIFGGFVATFAISLFVWSVIGSEFLVIKGASFLRHIRLGYLTLMRSREFNLNGINNLRVIQTTNSPWTLTAGNRGIGEGSIAFDYECRTYRFGFGLDEAEAERLVTEIRQRFDAPSSEDD